MLAESWSVVGVSKSWSSRKSKLFHLSAVKLAGKSHRNSWLGSLGLWNNENESFVEKVLYSRQLGGSSQLALILKRNQAALNDNNLLATIL